MVLKPTIIGLSAIRPLSPWERVREKAKRKTQETSSEKDGNTKHALPKHPKEKHKKQLLPKYVSDDLSPLKRTHVV